MSDSTTHLLLPYILAAQAQKHVTHNEALRILDGLVQLSVLDRDLTAPPGSPADGDRYIVATGATGDWAGWDLNVALWTDGAWLRLPPRTGWRAWVEDEGLLLIYDGAGWIGATPDALQNMALLGLGTTADASNPFSAKLNAALWTAKTVAEGGTGNLFYTMNKEAAGDDLGLTLQTGFVTKALVGLFGSDRFRLAVSADGSTFFDGLSVNNATGIVDQPRLPRFKAYTNYDNYVGVGTWTKIGLNNTDYNDQGAFDAANNNFVAPSDGTYLFGATPEDGILVHKEELVVRREERHRAEARHGLGGRRRTSETVFQQRHEFSEIILGERTFLLGPIQARVVRILHDAASSELPWRHGKMVLAEAGSSCTRMSDLFKTQPEWRKLIQSDRRGRYRLNIRFS